MKKFFILFSLIIPLAVLFGCAPKYIPDADYYFSFKDNYRVIEISGEPEHIEKYGLNSLTYPQASALADDVKVVSDEMFIDGSMFFDADSVKKMNKEGVSVIYDCLGLTSNEILEEYYACNYTNLYCFNKKVKRSVITFTADLSEYPTYTVVGEVSDVDIYTFNYIDLSKKNGEQVGKGSFKVIVCGTPVIDIFSIQ